MVRSEWMVEEEEEEESFQLNREIIKNDISAAYFSSFAHTYSSDWLGCRLGWVEKEVL